MRCGGYTMALSVMYLNKCTCQWIISIKDWPPLDFQSGPPIGGWRSNPNTYVGVSCDTSKWYYASQSRSLPNLFLYSTVVSMWSNCPPYPLPAQPCVRIYHGIVALGAKMGTMSVVAWCVGIVWCMGNFIYTDIALRNTIYWAWLAPTLFGLNYGAKSCRVPN